VVVRYNIYPYDQYSTDERTSPTGDWVRYEDYQALQAERDALQAQLAETTRAKECFQRMTRAHWEALCAMRNSINEHIPMPNTDSGPLFSPENGPIYADIAERVVAALSAAEAQLAKVEAMVEAAEMMVKAYREESDQTITAFYALEDALAAMKGK
jgi:hypothetical protein